MKILNFIVLDDNIKRSGDYKTAVNGAVYIPLDTTVPVILKGSGCIGVGIVRELRMSSSSTTIYYSLSTEISKESRTAYYNLYRDQVSTEQNDDPYDNTDMIIPGAIGSLKGSSAGNGSGKQKWKNNYHQGITPRFYSNED